MQPTWKRVGCWWEQPLPRERMTRLALKAPVQAHSSQLSPHILWHLAYSFRYVSGMTFVKGHQLVNLCLKPSWLHYLTEMVLMNVWIAPGIARFTPISPQPIPFLCSWTHMLMSASWSLGTGQYVSNNLLEKFLFWSRAILPGSGGTRL